MSKKEIIQEALEHTSCPDIYREDLDDCLQTLYDFVNEIHTMSLGANYVDGGWEFPKGEKLADSLSQIMDAIEKEQE